MGSESGIRSSETRIRTPVEKLVDQLFGKFVGLLLDEVSRVGDLIVEDLVVDLGGVLAVFAERHASCHEFVKSDACVREEYRWTTGRLAIRSLCSAEFLVPCSVACPE